LTGRPISDISFIGATVFGFGTSSNTEIVLRKITLPYILELILVPPLLY
jgi:hypothetical protein